VGWASGANPMTLSFNASAVKMYNATNIIARFSNKKYFPYFNNSLAYYNSGVVAVNSQDVGLAIDMC
jgi:hypothetical protein